MAYKPPQKSTFSTTYTPKYMAGDFRSKKVPAPEQPTELTISSYRIAQYVDQMVSDNNLREYKRLFEQIKILVKSVMKVLCEKKLTIDLSLWREVNKIHIPPTVKNVTITFPVQKYAYEQWVMIFRSLIPSVPYPFNAKFIDKPLNTSTSIELISPRSESSDLDEISEMELPNDYIEENHEEWYETAVYAYQNLLLTSSSKKREIIDEHFQEANSKARNRTERNKAHETRAKAINDLKKGTYDWVNRIGHIVKGYKYIRLNSKTNRITNSNDLIRYSDLILMNGVLNGSFRGTGLLTADEEYVFDSHTSHPKEKYMEIAQRYRNKDCTSDNPEKERSLYDTIAYLAWAFHDYHHGNSCNGLLHEYEIQNVVLNYLDGIVVPQQNQIRMIINKITDNKYDELKNVLMTFNRDMVHTALASNVHGEPQQQYIVRLMSEFNIRELVISELRNHQAKKFESYHNTVAWAILYGVIPFDIIYDETIFEPKVAIDIYIALLDSAKLNPKLIKDNFETIKANTNALLPTVTGYAKFRLSDAYTVANNAIINL